MPKTKVQKKEIVKSFSDKLEKSKSSVFINFKGLKVKDIESFRKKCREGGADYMVAKKTLMSLVCKEARLDFDPKSIAGDIGTVFGIADEIYPAKIVAEFSKSHEAMKILGGFLEKKFIDESRVKKLSKLPSRQELLAKMVGSMQAPISGFVNVLAGNLRGLVQVLKMISEKKV